MTMKKVGVRFEGETLQVLQNFATTHKMSLAASVEFFTKMGIDAIVKADAQLEAQNQTRKLLSEMMFSMHQAIAFIAMSQPQDAEKIEKSKVSAERAVTRIFGENDGND